MEISAYNVLPVLVGIFVWGLFWLSAGSELTYVENKGYPEACSLPSKLAVTTFVSLVATTVTWLFGAMIP